MNQRHVVQNSGDEDEIRRASQWQEDMDRDLDYLLQHKRGRRWLYRLIFDTCHVELRSHVTGDAESTAFNEGVRMIGQTILDDIRARDFDAYLQLIAEQGRPSDD